ncbi:MAG: hypothetical protein JW936_01855 [Sedimentisphaerales bacterium]|nr:hypothetical protein [Sedimentisphaerales bacterium]
MSYVVEKADCHSLPPNHAIIDNGSYGIFCLSKARRHFSLFYSIESEQLTYIDMNDDKLGK